MHQLRTPVGPQDHAVGPESARITVVEYGDFQCSYCAAAEPVVRELRTRGSAAVRVVFRSFPIPEIHPEALTAATLAELAADHGVFWEAHDLLFDHQDDLGQRLYARICGDLGIAEAEFAEALRDQRYIPRLTAVENSGIRSGVNGTPTFFVNGARLDAGVEQLARDVAPYLTSEGT